jgi:hypothetical protein
MSTIPRDLIKGRRRALLLLLLGTFVAGCDSLLEVNLPGNVEGGDLQNPALASTLVDSAVGQFEWSYPRKLWIAPEGGG